MQRGLRGYYFFWDKRRMELVDSEIGLFSISCLFKMVEGGFQWTFSRVYGPVERRLKEAFWEELGSIRGWWEGSWCFEGTSMRFSPPPKEQEVVISPIR